MSNKDFVAEEFASPSVMYRGRPFWSWNTEITPQKIESQVKMFHDMGYGGFVIHSRNGLRTEYLGKSFMDMVKLSIKCAEQYGLKVWLYDEDRWPSGSAGGYVTVDRKYRVKYLTFMRQRPDYPDSANKIPGYPYILAAFKLTFDDDGYLADYCLTDENNADIYACVMTAEDSPRYNGQANVDTLDTQAIKRFIEVTYEKYNEEIGEYFGNTVEAIFTDEPHCMLTDMLKYSELELLSEVKLAWTDTLPDTYFERYREDIVSHLPELLWERADGKYSTVRYRYNEHIATLFKKAYSEQIGNWCREHGIKFTGHYLSEEKLNAQTSCTRDVMRCYPDEDIPGIDILQGKYEFSTAVQCKSIAHQYAREQVMSELYGVNNWDTDFREYLHQGNWQAAMGINIRIPHLTWMTMLGEGKRDYPATFGYQSPWYLDNNILENYFSRLHTVLTNGKPIVDVAVVSPIESMWLIYGVNDKTSRAREEYNEHFSKLYDWLSFDGVDFDLLCEALLEDLGTQSGTVGKMKYKAVIVPSCLTLRRTTLDALRNLKKHGVRIIFAGNIPEYVDGAKNDAAMIFADECEKIDYSHIAFQKALRNYRAFGLINSKGKGTNRFIFQERELDGDRWIFLSPAKKISDTEDSSLNGYTLTLDGRCTPILYDAMTGEHRPLPHKYINNKTYVELSLSAYSTALIRIAIGESDMSQNEADMYNCKKVVSLGNSLEYKRAEDNVCLLDMAEYSFDGEEWSDLTEILAVDTICRERYDLPTVTGKSAAQPWCIVDDKSHDIWLRYTVNSEVETDCKLAFERVEEILLNDMPVTLDRIGFYVDEDITAIKLPRLKVGNNVIIARMKITKTYGLEPMYLLGDFDVALRGVESTIKACGSRLSFGSVISQGLPFYAGSFTYRTELDVIDGALEVSLNHYRCEFVKIYLDGEHKGNIIMPPYCVKIDNVSGGKHVLEIECVGNRHNTFGSLHWGIYDAYYGPSHWHKSGDAFSREYKLRDFGVMKSPIVVNTYNEA